MDRHPSQPLHIAAKAAARVVIDLSTPSPTFPPLPTSTPPKVAPRTAVDLLTPSPPSKPLPPSTPQRQTEYGSPSATYSALSTSKRTASWLHTPSDAQSLDNVEQGSGLKKNTPRFTAVQREYITRLSRQGRTLKKIQHEFDIEFPGNTKETWEIKGVRTSAIRIKKGKEVWDAEEGTGLSKKMARQAEARKRAKDRKEEFVAIASGKRPLVNMGIDESFVEKEKDRDMVERETTTKGYNAFDDSPLSRRGQPDRDRPDRSSPTPGRGNRDALQLEGPLAKMLAELDEESDLEKEC